MLAEHLHDISRRLRLGRFQRLLLQFDGARKLAVGRIGGGPGVQKRRVCGSVLVDRHQLVHELECLARIAQLRHVGDGQGPDDVVDQLRVLAHIARHGAVELFRRADVLGHVHAARLHPGEQQHRLGLFIPGQFREPVAGRIVERRRLGRQQQLRVSELCVDGAKLRRLQQQRSGPRWVLGHAFARVGQAREQQHRRGLLQADRFLDQRDAIRLLCRTREPREVHPSEFQHRDIGSGGNALFELLDRVVEQFLLLIGVGLAGVGIQVRLREGQTRVQVAVRHGLLQQAKGGGLLSNVFAHQLRGGGGHRPRVAAPGEIEQQLRHAGGLFVLERLNLQQPAERRGDIEHQRAQWLGRALTHEQIEVQFAFGGVGVDRTQANEALLPHEPSGVARGDRGIGSGRGPVP